MRIEHDSNGEKQISDGVLYGISTARCLDAYSQIGPRYPDRFLFWLLKTRASQALSLFDEGAMDSSLSAAYSSVLKKLLSETSFLVEHIIVRPVYDVSGRLLVRNLDEVLINLTLRELGHSLGEYHRVSPLSGLSAGYAPVESFQLSVRIALNELMNTFLSDLTVLYDQLLKAAENEQEIFRLFNLQMHSVAIRSSAHYWLEFSEVVHNAITQILSLIELPIPTKLSRKSITILRRELKAHTSLSDSEEHGVSVYDYLARAANEVLIISGRLIQFANLARMRVDCQNDATWPQLLTVDPFNPKLNEPTIADILFQEAVLVQTSIDRINRLRYSSFGEIDAFVPLAAVELNDVISIVGAACRKLSHEWLHQLHSDANLVQSRLRASPLKVEVLIPILGMDRAIQVAKMAALTGRSVSSVVEKMKLLSPEQLQALFPDDDLRNIER